MNLHDFVCLLLHKYFQEKIDGHYFDVFISYLGKKEKVRLVGVELIEYKFSKKGFRADLLLKAENGLLLPLEMDITTDNTDRQHKTKREEAFNLGINLIGLHLDQLNLKTSTEEEILQKIDSSISNGQLFYIVKSKPKKMVWKSSVIYAHTATVKKDYITFFDVNGTRYFYSKEPLPPKRERNILKEYSSQSYYISYGEDVKIPFKY